MRPYSVLLATRRAFFKIVDANDGEHGSEDFFLGEGRVGSDVGNHGGFEEVAAAGSLHCLAAVDEAAFFFAVSM